MDELKDMTNWIRQPSRFGDEEIHCEKCGAKVDYENWLNYIHYYCYHCGAKAKRPLVEEVRK